MSLLLPKRAALAAMLAIAALVPAKAQDAQQAPAEAAEAPAAPEASPSHTKAAIEFIQASGALRSFESMIPQFLDQVRLQYVKQRPEIQDLVNEVVLALVSEFMVRLDDLSKDLSKVYTARFTEEELVQMKEFYLSPVGKKLSQIQPEVLQASVPVVQAWSRKLVSDVQSRVKEEVSKKGQKL
jgi:hypothetical protein